MTVPTVSLRPFAARDFDDLVAQWHDTNRSAYWYNATQQAHTLDGARAFFRATILARCDVVVAVQAATLLGVIAVEGPWVRTLAVFAPFRRSGIGTRLLQWARDRSPAELRLYTFRRNAAARAFYEHHGFTAVAFGTSPPPENEPDVEYAWRAAR